MVIIRKPKFAIQISNKIVLIVCLFFKEIHNQTNDYLLG